MYVGLVEMMEVSSDTYVKDVKTSQSELSDDT